MTEKASADDFQDQDFLKKKKKKKKKKKRKHEEYNNKHENYERETIPNEELSPPSPLLFEDQAAQSGEGHRKKKKSKDKEEKEQSLLGNSCVGLDLEISNGTGMHVSQKKKRKKKHKYDDSTDVQSDVTCITVNQHSTDSCQDMNAGYVYLKHPVKKKKKEKLPEEDEIHELPTSKTHDENDIKRSKKKKKRDNMQEDADVTIDQSRLSSPEQNRQREDKKKKKRKRDNMQEDADVIIDQSRLSSPEQNRQGEDKKKKKKKRKRDNMQEDADVIIDQSRLSSPEQNRQGEDKKKKKKRKGDNIHEDTDVIIDHSRLSSPEQNRQGEDKKKKKKRKGDNMQEDADVIIDQSRLSSPEQNRQGEDKKKKKKKRKRDNIHENTDVTSDHSLLSSSEQNRQGEDMVLPLPTEEDDMAMPQQWHENGDSDAACAMSEDSTDVPANFSKSTKAADQSRKTPRCARKKVKSRAFVMQESSSESDVTTPEPSASNGKKDQNSSFTEMVASDEDCVDYTLCSVVDLDTAKQELEEFIPHVRTLAETSIRKMAGRDLMRFKEFKKQGIAIKFGRFSEKENNQIRKNIEDFLSITGIDSAEKLLFTSRYPEDKETISRLKAENLFCEKISEGIPRPWRLIYYRARKMFDPNNYKGRYTKTEKEKLKSYHALHGNDWKKISEMMSRSTLSVAMKYSEIKSAVNYGPWSKNEIQKLMDAVEEVIRKRTEMEGENSHASSEKSNRDVVVKREKLLEKLPWTEIEAKVGTRYWRQCKQKWTAILTKKMTKGQQLYRGIKGLQAKINLIKRLHEMKVEDPNEVNWEELSNIVGDVPKGYVQAKFYKLKVSCVPFWQKKTFSEIVDYIFEKKLPELEEKLQKMKGKHNSDDSTTSQQKKAFRLSDIFDSSEESDSLP